MPLAWPIRSYRPSPLATSRQHYSPNLSRGGTASTAPPLLESDAPSFQASLHGRIREATSQITEYGQLFDENGQANPLLTCNENSDRHSRRSRGSQYASRSRRTSNGASSALRPTEKQYRFVETISNRLGIENPWTKRGCIFRHSYDGDLPRFMDCGPTRYEASKWIGRHQSKFNEALAAKKASNPAFSVYRIEYTDGTFFLHIGTQANHMPSIDALKGRQIAGISVWVGESMPKQKLAGHTLLRPTTSTS